MVNKFYKSKEWISLLKVLKNERNMTCEYCGEPIVKKYDCIGHHKIELNDININDSNISLNPENIMLVHHKCHNKLHERFGSCERKIFIIYGPPCAGKSTWVKNVAHYDDIILDIDKLWESICLSDKYHKPNRLKSNVFGLRDSLIDMIKCRVGQWRNAYIIGGYPLASDRERLSKLLGAELIYIEEDKNVCLGRCKTDEWKTYVEDWFDLYTPG